MNNINNIFVDLHILQTLPPSNVNRDDTGSPKEAYFGGVRRARVSSQSWKRATRLHFSNYLDPEVLGSRTKRIAKLLKNELIEGYGYDEQMAAELSLLILEPLKISNKSKRSTEKAETDYLLFFGKRQISDLAESIRDLTSELKNDLENLTASSDEKNADNLRKSIVKKIGDKVDVLKFLKSNHPYDVGLFGRMVADRVELNIDAAVQVAHAISTHATTPEYDYYTALDDELGNDEQGAAMLGTIEFNSATMYRYASLSIHQLHENLSKDWESTANSMAAFLKSFILSVPTGHINSFAHNSLPNLVLLIVWENSQPVNLVTAFEKPITNNFKNPETSFLENGYVLPSIKRLSDEFNKIKAQFNLRPQMIKYICEPNLQAQIEKPNQTDEYEFIFKQPVDLDTMLTDIKSLIQNKINFLEDK